MGDPIAIENVSRNISKRSWNEDSTVYTETINERSSVETTGPGAGSEETTLSFSGKGAGPSELGFNCFVTVTAPARFQPSKKQRTTRTEDGEGGGGQREETRSYE